jgi:hypothetical protein
MMLRLMEPVSFCEFHHPRVKVLNHSKNLGKGAALRLGFAATELLPKVVDR